MAQVLYSASDNLIVVSGLYNNLTEEFVNNATINVTLLDGAGDEVSGGSWPVSASYVSGSDGKYIATLQDTINIVVGTKYAATIEVTVGGSLVRTFYLDLIAIEDRRG